MQSCTCCKFALFWSGVSSISRILLLSSIVFSIQLTRVEAAPPLASPCTLAWNPDPDPGVSGFCLYYGINGSTTTNRLDVGMTNLVTLNNLFSSSNYFFYVVAYNISRIESPPSTVMYYTPPALSGLKLTPLANRTMSLHFLAATGAVCHVEFTPTLNPPQWQTLSNATADVNGHVTLTDPLSGHPPARFYRTALP
jgi:hypothetical protein